ncbi:hypothetical protein I862_05025 [endosymbiont of Acanthamoeba sp. UWC8]|uniref:hypothetical protein n=1 Tax=endosymbiont of Acanthamoeba sp. UWC8 TaxID=86106 RepID=UPI0004D1FE3C|nr:hypothetical protein [endosymbiont of Acanthamoeba sp. UWC8]AIF81561.1 hypothetical protein I862_05025 [endosymbiont of Acanthamoeba sp. UWC8]
MANGSAEKKPYQKALDKAKLREASFLLRKIAHICEEEYQSYTEADAPKMEFIQFLPHLMTYKKDGEFIGTPKEEIINVYGLEIEKFETSVKQKVFARNDPLFNSYKLSLKDVHSDLTLRDRLIKFCVAESSDLEDQYTLCSDNFISYAKSIID